MVLETKKRPNNRFPGRIRLSCKHFIWNRWKKNFHYFVHDGSVHFRRCRCRWYRTDIHTCIQQVRQIHCGGGCCHCCVRISEQPIWKNQFRLYYTPYAEGKSKNIIIFRFILCSKKENAKDKEYTEQNI